MEIEKQSNTFHQYLLSLDFCTHNLKDIIWTKH